MKYFWMVFSLFFIILCGCANSGIQKVEVRKTAAGYQLFRGGKPYYIKGAGILDHYKMLSEYGGNSVRTWGITEWDEVFSLAEKYGLTVCQDKSRVHIYITAPNRMKSITNYG